MYNFLLPLLFSGALFTFDDGPHIKYTPRVLNVLKKHRVRAVFCIPAITLYNKKKLAISRRIVREGHIVCNHSYSHPNFAKLSPRRQWWQIRYSQRLFKKRLGVTPTLFRPPGGRITSTMRAALRYHKLKMFMWDIDPRDWSRKTTPNSIYRKVVYWWRYRRLRKKSSVILFHDTSWKTARVLERIILRIKRRP